MKRCVVFLGLVLIAIVAFALWPRQTLTEQRARETAQTRFEHVCRDSHLDSLDYDGPISTTVGGAQFAYEWKSKRKGQHTILVSVAKDGGIVEPTFLDDDK